MSAAIVTIAMLVIIALARDASRSIDEDER